VPTEIPTDVPTETGSHVIVNVIGCRVDGGGGRAISEVMGFFTFGGVSAQGDLLEGVLLGCWLRLLAS